MKIDLNSGIKECSHIIRLLEPDESYRLEALYSVLDFDGRRNRFGAAICDVSLRSYCRSLDWTCIVVVGAFKSRRMEAAIELVPLSRLGRRRNRGDLLSSLARRSRGPDVQLGAR